MMADPMLRGKTLISSPFYFEIDKKKNGKEVVDLRWTSQSKIWWLCKNGHSWLSSPRNRSRGINCPFCLKTNKASAEEIKSLYHLFSAKNDINPSEMSDNLCKQYIWECSQGHQWLAPIGNQLKRLDCVRCDNRILEPETFLKQLYPECSKIQIVSLLADKMSSGVLTFYEDEVCYKLDIVRSYLNYEIGKTYKLSARRLSVETVDMDVAWLFEKANSLQSSPRYGYALGLYKESELIQVLRYLPQKSGVIRLFGVTTKRDWSVHGGVSKLLTHMVNRLPEEYIPIKIVASVNLRFNTGQYLSRLGFKYIKTVKYQVYSNGAYRTSKAFEGTNKITEPGLAVFERRL